MTHDRPDGFGFHCACGHPEAEHQMTCATCDPVPFPLQRLIEAKHAISHEYAHLWPPTDGCGCREWAEALIRMDAILQKPVDPMLTHGGQ